MQSFVCYRLKSQIGATPVNGFDDFIAYEEGSAVRPVPVNVPIEPGADAAIYLIPSVASEPDWARFIRGGIGEDVQIPSASAPGALVLVRVKVRRKFQYFAFTFGTGRYLLKKDAYHRRFGLRVALNAVFEGDTAALVSDATRLRSIDAKRVSSKTVRMRHQTAQIADFEDFDVDRNRDFLRGVTGVPQQTGLWGRNITGSDSLTVNLDLSFSELPAFCRQLEKTYVAKSYRHRFGWVDDVEFVRDAGLLEQLEELVIHQLQDGKSDNLELNIPEVVEWDRIKSFILPMERRPRVERPDLRLADYIRLLGAKHLLSDLDTAKLRAHQIDVIDGSGEKWKTWSIWQCLTGELDLGNRKFILDEGDFYEISSTFLGQLDSDIKRLVPASTLILPQANVRWTEDIYNKYAASLGLLLLDKRNVKVSRSTSQIEICDLLSPDGQFVHVKRKLGSALLSHLFAQGAVSADLLQTSPDYRQVAGAMVRTVLSETSGFHLDASTSNLFRTRTPAPGTEVVYAIVADWQEDAFVDRLPFFSKINLRRHANDLRARGFNVTHVRVQTHP